MKVAYLMSHYPAVSHAFVLREVKALRDLEVDVETMSIHRAERDDLLAEADRDAAATTFSVLPARLHRIATAHIAALLRSPRAYLSTLWLALRTGAPGARDRLWHVFYFAEAMIVLRHCRRSGIEHIHAQFADSATDVAMLVAHYYRRAQHDGRALTWSLAVHGSVEFYNVERYALARKLQRATFAVAISDFGRSQLMRLSEREQWSHIHVVRCGVDPTIYEPSATRREPDRAVSILFVGRLLHSKGLSLLFESAVELISEGCDIALTIVGDGPARSELEQSARALGLWGRVRFLGAVGQDDIRNYYADADIFCLPSFAEGLPVVAMEAMAMELPVVLTRIMGVPELVEDGTEGLLVVPGRVDALTAALGKLVRSPALRRKLGAGARRRVAVDYDVRASARRMRAVLEHELRGPLAPSAERDGDGRENVARAVVPADGGRAIGGVSGET